MGTEQGNLVVGLLGSEKPYLAPLLPLPLFLLKRVHALLQVYF